MQSVRFIRGERPVDKVHDLQCIGMDRAIH